MVKKSKQYMITLLFCLVFAGPSHSFSILAHEAIIDAAWTSQIVPLLLKKYPATDRSQLNNAQAYAYGDSLLADMGYIPGGCPYFTNLLHYVRSGDYVMALLNNAENLYEYAFAVGALSHYMADKYGHALATNVSVGIVDPRLKEKFGAVITYDNDHTSHSSLEFAYDVIQTAKGNYASKAYHKFIGFQIAVPLVSRSFLQIYGQQLNTVFPNFESSINTFRWGVRYLFPELAAVAWRSDKAGIEASNRSVTRHTFHHTMPQIAFNKQFGETYDRSGFMARWLAKTIQKLPKVGVLKKLRFRYPGAVCEELFLRSMDSIMANYKLAMYHAADDRLNLANINFDTGNPTTLNEYRLTDDTYNEWLSRLQTDTNARITANLKRNIAAFYHNNIPVELAVNFTETTDIKTTSTTLATAALQ